MKQVNFARLFLCVAIGALFIAGAQPGVAADSGRLVIKRSATLGSFVTVTVRIDGKLAGILTRGRTLETQLAAGSHKLTADPGSGRRPWHGTLNVRAGETYTYTASLAVDALVLTPTASR